MSENKDLWKDFVNSFDNEKLKFSNDFKIDLHKGTKEPFGSDGIFFKDDKSRGVMRLINPDGKTTEALEKEKEYADQYQDSTNVLEIILTKNIKNFSFVMYKFYDYSLGFYYKEKFKMMRENYEEDYVPKTKELCESDEEFRYFLNGLFNILGRFHLNNTTLNNISADNIAIRIVNQKKAIQLFNFSQSVKNEQGTLDVTKDICDVGLLVFSILDTDLDPQEHVGKIMNLGFAEKIKYMSGILRTQKIFLPKSIKSLAHLICSLVSKKHFGLRSCDYIRDHPYFWVEDDGINFIKKCRELTIYGENERKKDLNINSALNQYNDWRGQLGNNVQSLIPYEYEPYTSEIIRFIKNHNSHQESFEAKELKKVFHNYRGVITYISSKIPDLMFDIYLYFKKDSTVPNMQIHYPGCFIY